MSTIEVSTCRGCGSQDLQLAVDLGSIPIVNRLRSSESVHEEREPRYPLRLVRCAGCGLAQTDLAISRDIIFGEGYPYLSSYSSSLLDQSSRFADDCCERYGIDKDSFVVEIASNDGYLLRNFVARDIPALGIEPAPIPAGKACEIGVNTRETYFEAGVATEIVEEFGPSDLIIANNVLAHIHDVSGFLDGVSRMIAPEGIFVFEVQYLTDLLRTGAFDTIYHEHQCYFTLTVLSGLLSSFGLRCFDVQSIAAQGGSIRVWAAPSSSAFEETLHFRAVMENEAATDTGGIKSIETIQQQASATGSALRETLGNIREAGGRIAAYGAAAKGAVLVNICQLEEFIDYVVDLSPVKQKHFLPGTSVPIVPAERLQTDPPTHLLILAWNLADEIMAQLAEEGFRFILPLPTVEIIEPQ